MAGQYSAPLLQLSHHGRTGDDLRGDHVPFSLSSMAQAIVHRAVDVVDTYAEFSIPLYREHCGWITAEVGRQPWLVYGLLRTNQGYSANVSAGNGLFTLLGFMGLYALLAIFFLVLVFREIEHGPPLFPNREPQPISVAGD